MQLVGKGDDIAATETPEQQRAREAAEKSFLERKAKAKKRRDANEQRLKQVINEKQVSSSFDTFNTSI